MVSNEFLNQLRQFVQEEKLYYGERRTLLAVSGGVDSVVLAHVFAIQNLQFEIAHCNFQLRGEESMKDEEFVRALAESYKVPFHCIRFDTEKVMQETKKGVQETARNLRYEWFEQIRKERKLDWIATAHHADDQVETILSQFIKGTGIRGLRGMKVKRGRIFHPLLFAFKTDLDNYREENKLAFREDSSNQSLKYTRNKIRHELIPLIESLNPGFKETLLNQRNIYEELEGIYNKTIAKHQQQLFIQKGDEVHIPILKLQKTPHASSVLYEYLKPLGFTKHQMVDIFNALQSTSGTLFLSPTHRLIKDRTFLILAPLTDAKPTEYLMTFEDFSNREPVELPDFVLESSVTNYGVLRILTNPDYAFIDLSKLEFPLILRHWKVGDYFYPFGMNSKKKKVSKFFKDLKLNIVEKDQVWILESRQRIVWVVGYRIDERFCVTANTKQVAIFQKQATGV